MARAPGPESLSGVAACAAIPGAGGWLALWHTDLVSPATLQSLLVVAGLLVSGVFIAAFRFALRETSSHSVSPYEADLPRAELFGARVTSNNRWHRGVARQRLLGGVHVVQAGLVAFGITSVFIMFVCMAGVIASMLFGSG